ncbi:hypothetical protein GCM10020331_012230 [Ectobacillus funiculus]
MNYTAFQWINGWAGHSALLDKTMIWITNSAPFVAVLFMIILWFSSANRKKPQWQNNIRRYIQFLSMMLALFF